jgi:hypothetical protein
MRHYPPSNGRAHVGSSTRKAACPCHQTRAHTHTQSGRSHLRHYALNAGGQRLHVHASSSGNRVLVVEAAVICCIHIANGRGDGHLLLDVTRSVARLGTRCRLATSNTSLQLTPLTALMERSGTSSAPVYNL